MASSVFACREGSKPLDTLLYAPHHGINTPQSNYILSQAEKSKFTCQNEGKGPVVQLIESE